MTAKGIVPSLAVVGAVLIGCQLLAGDNTVDRAGQAAAVIVGTFDSRAVAVAFAGSKWFDELRAEVRAEVQKAKAAGDAAKLEEIRKRMIERQKQMHFQGFGTADVSEYLKYIKDDIPKIAAETGVDVIVSKWDVVYRGPSVKFVDITDALVRPFGPSEKALKSIRELKKHDPVPIEQLEKMDHERD